MAPRQLQKGAKATKEWARTFADLRTCEKEIHEKDKVKTLMSLIILEIDQCGEEAEFWRELMTWRASLSKIMESKPTTKAQETAKRTALASAQREPP